MTVTIDLFDPATRPKMPKIEGVTDAQLHQGRHLAAVHAMHLRQMAHARRVMEEVARGEAELSKLDTALTELDMRHNYRVFGNVCGQECQMLTAHHSIEDRYIFAPLAQQDNPFLRKVVERLRAEHGVIHDYLVKMDEAIAALMDSPTPETFATLREVFEELEEFVISHFGYEQEELFEAMGYYEIDI